MGLRFFQQYLQEFLLMYFRGLYLCYCLGSLWRMLIPPVKLVRGRMFLHSDFLEDWMMLLLFGECWTFLLVQVKKSLNCSALFWGFVTVLLSISTEEGPFVYFALFEWIMSWIHGYNVMDPWIQFFLFSSKYFWYCDSLLTFKKFTFLSQYLLIFLLFLFLLTTKADVAYIWNRDEKMAL